MCYEDSVNLFTQFVYISEAQSTPADLPSMAEERYLERCRDQLGSGYRPRSHSLNVYEMSRAKSLVERMKHTFEFKLNQSKGFDSYKGNIRGEYIQASFTTLEELFVKLPESVRFDIEISEPFSSQHSQKKRLHKLNLSPPRISDALRSSRLGNGHLRCGIEPPRGYHPRESLPACRKSHHLLFLLQPRDLHSALQ